MLEIREISFDGLSDDEKDEQPNNGSGKEYASYLKITHNGKTISIHSDAMEPEDASFGRDLRWVSGSIKTAYEIGKQDV